MKQFILRLLVFILFVAVGAVALRLGLYFKNNNESIYSIIQTIAIIVFIINILIHIISYFIWLQYIRNNRYNSKEMKARFDENRELAQADIYAYKNKIESMIAKYDKYYLFIPIFMTLSFALICFIANPSIIIFVFLLGLNPYLIISNTINFEKIHYKGFEIKQKQFPLLWKIINKTAALFDINKKIYCAYDFGNSAFVSQRGNKVYIIFGIFILQAMNEAEIESILIHEFAHVYNTDTVHSYKLDKQMKKWYQFKQKNNFLMKYIFAPIADKLIEEYQIYISISTKIIEVNAEKKAKTIADRSAFINSLAKLNLLNYYLNSEKYSSISIYENDTFTNQYFNFIYNRFLNHYYNNKDEWERIITLRIPDSNDSHPTFKERMGIYEIDDFNINFESQIPELPLVLDRANKKFYELNCKSYQFSRETYYLKPLERIKKYEENPDDYNRRLLIEVAGDYRSFGRLEDALAIYDKILAEEKESAEVIFLKGTLLLSMENDQGIDYIYQAIELNDQFLINGVPYIRDYCTMMGLKERFAEVKEFTDAKRDYVINVKLQQEVKLNDRFFKTTLSEEAINEIVGFISQDDCIKLIRIADKIIDEENRVIVIGIMVEIYALSILSEILNRINDYIYNERQEAIVLIPLDISPVYNRKLKIIKGSIVYKKTE